jgi:hypothetical protein
LDDTSVWIERTSATDADAPQRRSARLRLDQHLVKFRHQPVDGLLGSEHRQGGKFYAIEKFGRSLRQHHRCFGSTNIDTSPDVSFHRLIFLFRTEPAAAEPRQGFYGDRLSMRIQCARQSSGSAENIEACCRKK